jgi:hypothetical protein
VFSARHIPIWFKDGKQVPGPGWQNLASPRCGVPSNSLLTTVQSVV